MFLSAFLHRDEFHNITNRWLSDQLDQEDPRQITKIIAFDSFAAWESLLLFSDYISQNLANNHVTRKSISQKKDLKSFICNVKNKKNERSESLIHQYMKMPEFFYVGAPIKGCIYKDSRHQVVSTCRFKRVKRIAEKASRYASLYVFDQVQKKAKEIMKKRIKPLDTGDGNHLSNGNFFLAEKAVMSHIMENGIQLPVQSMAIKDVLGIKVIDNGYGEKMLESAISKNDTARIIGKKIHTGNYNAVHYVVELTVDFNHLNTEFSRRWELMDLSKRGLIPEIAKEDFAKFIRSAADCVYIELIFITYDELIESEIGRSMHESRIFKQRRQNKIYGNIPMNIEFIIEYLIAVGLSPTILIDEIPIKIWGRYLPDTLSHRIRKLYQMPDYSMI